MRTEGFRDFVENLTGRISRRHIPTVIVQGRYDVICPVSLRYLVTCFAVHRCFSSTKATTAYALKKVSWFFKASASRACTCNKFPFIQAFPEAEFHIVPDAGHSARETGTTKLLVEVRCWNRNFPQICSDKVCRRLINSRDK